jgi:hypothetical protein
MGLPADSADDELDLTGSVDFGIVLIIVCKRCGVSTSVS